MSPSPPPATDRTAFVALGSNLGDRRQHLADALVRLERDPATRLVAVSSFYATDPVGLPGEPEFLNAVAQVATQLDPEALLDLCLRIESEMGRVRTGRTESRPIDLDVLIYENERLTGGRLTLPHPRLKDRAFVLVPLAEIAPDWPIEGRSAAEWAAQLDQTGIRKITA